MYGFKNLINEIATALTPSDFAGDPTNKDMPEIRQCHEQITNLCGDGKFIDKIKGNDHTYSVNGVYFRIENGDTVIPL